MERATVDVYEQHAADWQARRPPRRREDAQRLGRAVAPGAVRVDLGSGPGSHTPDLGRPVLALDAAFAMVELATHAAPDAWPVNGDLESLPFRDRSLGGAWARASYLHVPTARLPLALAQLHRALAVGVPFHGTVKVGDGDGPLDDDDFPGRLFGRWQPDAFADVLLGAGFAVEELELDGEWIRFCARRARSLPDTVGRDMRCLVCGLNPSVYAADAGVGFARPGNRFWPAALDAGLVTRDRDPWHALVAHGVGMTDLVKRATPAAKELTADEFRAGAERVRRLVEWLQPGVIVFVGLAGWRAAVDAKAGPGRQPDPFGGRPAYVMPSTSGLNASARLEDLTAHLRTALAVAEGISRPGA